MVLAALGAFQPDDQWRCAALRCAALRPASAQAPQRQNVRQLICRFCGNCVTIFLFA
jgi:hypothetical protein